MNFQNIQQLRLIHFFVQLDELSALVPKDLPIRKFGESALVIMADMLLKGHELPGDECTENADDRQIELAVLVDDSSLNAGVCKGLFPMATFLGKGYKGSYIPLTAKGKVKPVSIKEAHGEVVIENGVDFIHYAFINTVSAPKEQEFLQALGPLDRVYNKVAEGWEMTQVVHQPTRMEGINCYHFESNLFKTARLTGALNSSSPLMFELLPPSQVNLPGSHLDKMVA